MTAAVGIGFLGVLTVALLIIIHDLERLNKLISEVRQGCDDNRRDLDNLKQKLNHATPWYF